MSTGSERQDNQTSRQGLLHRVRSPLTLQTHTARPSKAQSKPRRLTEVPAIDGHERAARLSGALPHLPALALEAPGPLLLPLPPHLGGGLLPRVRLVRHLSRTPLEQTKGGKSINGLKYGTKDGRTWRGFGGSGGGLGGAWAAAHVVSMAAVRLSIRGTCGVRKSLAGLGMGRWYLQLVESLLRRLDHSTSWRTHLTRKCLANINSSFFLPFTGRDGHHNVPFHKLRTLGRDRLSSKVEVGPSWRADRICGTIL